MPRTDGRKENAYFDYVRYGVVSLSAHDDKLKCTHSIVIQMEAFCGFSSSPPKSKSLRVH